MKTTGDTSRCPSNPAKAYALPTPAGHRSRTSHASRPLLRHRGRPLRLRYAYRAQNGTLTVQSRKSFDPVTEGYEGVATGAKF